MNNRVIKFRIWHKGKNKWLHKPGEECNLLGEVILCGAFCPAPLEELNDLEELQYLGKSDKNGKEIYEGDIVKFDIKGATHGRYREEGNIGHIWYNEENCNWAIGKFHHKSEFSDYHWHWSFSDDIDWKTLEVIGNIFENKELIKS